MPSFQSDALTAPLLAQEDEEHGLLERGGASQAPRGGVGDLPSQSKGLCTPFRAGRMLLHSVLLWYQTTTNPEFLQSPMSRRRSWKWVWPALTTLGLVADATALAAGSGTSSWSIVCFDAVLVLIALLVCVRYALHLNTVQADFVLCVPYLASYAWWQLSTAARDGPDAVDGGTLSKIILFFCCVGVHSSISLLTLGFSTIAEICLSRQWEDTFAFVINLLVTSVSAVVLEFCIASLYQDLQAKATCNQQLLDFATDGFGALQRTSWQLTQVSQKMAETFGCSEEELLGCRLDELIDERDRDCVATFLENAAGQASSPSALLVTASRHGWQFEVRLMPYKIDHDGAEIGFCMQLMGEMRAVQTAPKAPAAATLIAGGAIGQPCPAAEDIEVAEVEEEGSLPPSSEEELHQPQGPAPRASTTCVQQQTREATSRPTRPWSTRSLSSWTISGPSVKTARPKPKKDMRDQTTQTGERQRRRPPAPLAAATGNLLLATKPTMLGAGRQTRSRKGAASNSGQLHLPDVRIEEGRPVLSRYAATPRSTRGNCLNSLAKSFNITGPGCCAKHVGYMALYDVVLEELMGSCGRLVLNSDWQCPDCLSLNKWQEDDDGSESESDRRSMSGQSEQFCMICGTVVENAVRGTAIPASLASSSGVEASDSTVG